MLDRPKCPDCDLPLQGRGEKSVSGVARWRCGNGMGTGQGCGRSFTTNTLNERDDAFSQLCAKNLEKLKKSKKKRLVVTSAQNNTAKSPGFLKSLLVYCEENDADLAVIPMHYKNISLYTAGQQYKKRWDPDLNPYYIEDDYVIGNVIVKASQKISATAANPLQGKQAIGGEKWTVYGHSQIALESVPNTVGELTKQMHTTGALTQRNYSKTVEGSKAEFHHVCGALIIESTDKGCFIRQLNADSRGRFYDLDKVYGSEGSEKAETVALITGDTHVRFMLPSVKKATFSSKTSIAKRLKPKYLVSHDLFDCHSVSKHHLKDSVLQFAKHHSGGNNLQAELDECVDFLNELPEMQHIIVASNHDDHLAEFLNRIDLKQDHENALLIADLQKGMREAVLKGKDSNPLALYMKPKLKVKAKFLKRQEEFSLRGILLSNHGDQGANGARGGIGSFAKIVSKIVVGHSHTAGINKGAYCVGTCTGTLGYEGLISSHSNSHVLLYPNGKRALITIIEGQWHG